MVQRVDEGPAVTVDPCGFRVRQVARGLGSTASATTITTTTATTTTGILPCLPPGDQRFSPTLTFNGGAAAGGVGPASAFHLQRHKGGGGAATAAAPFPATPLALYEYAAVDFFVMAAGCPTEVDFLRLETCVDIRVGGLEGGGGVLTVPLKQGREFVEAAVREIGARGAMKKAKRRGGF